MLQMERTVVWVGTNNGTVGRRWFKLQCVHTTSIQVCILCLLAADHSRLLHLSLCINVS